MAMGRKERKELVAVTNSWLEEVLPASGKPEELVRLTTQIVQSAKKLLEETPENLRVRSTATLSEFVVAARTIAKDPTSMDRSGRQRLSNSRRAVEALVKELDSWHESRHRARKSSEDAEVVLSRLASETAPGVPNNAARPTTGSNGVTSAKGGPSTQGTEDGKEKQLKGELKKEQIALWKKTEPQQAPVQHGEPSQALTTATGELQSAARSLVEVASQKGPSTVELLEPALQLSEAVSLLIDIVDSLFVSRYPMRSQVHNFCCTLVENTLAYGSKSRTDDLQSLRTITTEVPALLSAAEVMITQCHKRAQDIVGSRKLSMQRTTELQSLDSVALGVKKRAPPPKPPGEKKEEEQAEFEIICVLCTNVAVNQESKKPMPKGTEVPLMAYPSTSILDVRRMLSTRTGLPRDHIEIKMQGDDVLPDSTRVKPNTPVPYFVFNTHEPTEEELKEMRKLEKIRNRPRLEDVDWSQYSGAVAIALYEYDALGEEGNLSFDEGDIVRIIEKSPDGWWTGQIDDQVGDFPASFVEEIKIPQTKEERKRLAQRFKKKSPTEKHADSGFSEALENRPQFQIGSRDDDRVPSIPKVFKKLQSNPEGASPTPRPKFDRTGSEPAFSQFEQLSVRKDKKKLGIFKKRTTQYGAIQEEKDSASDPRPRSPLLSSDRRLRPVTSTSSWDEAMMRSESPEPLKKPLVKPMASPMVSKRKKPGAESSPHLNRPRRPPPPVPQAARAPRKSPDAEDHSRWTSEERSPDREGEGKGEPVRRSPNHHSPETSRSPDLLPDMAANNVSEREGSEEVKSSPPTSADDTVKKSESMEELLKNLEEFDEVISSQNGPETPDTEQRERDFATIPRSELPVKKTPAISITEAGQKVKSQTPELPRKPKPDLAPKPNLVQNGLSHTQKETESAASPKAPPRRKKGTRLSQKLKERMGKFESSGSSGEAPIGRAESPQPVQPSTSSSPPPKPARDEKKRMKTRLEAMLEKQACSSAPVSRTVSPENQESNLKKEGSVSTEALASHSPALSKHPAPNSPSIKTALKCISFLSEGERVADENLFNPSNGSSRRVEAWLSAVDRGEDPDLSSMPDASTAAALLKALLMNGRIGPLIAYPLAKAMCDLVKSASPVSVLGSQLEQLTPQHRGLLKQLLRLFGTIINHSHKNHTEVSELNKMFGPLLFDRLPSAQSEPLMAYLISTCELILT